MSININFVSNKNLTQLQIDQTELDNYWKRDKSNLEIGELYERYVGYIYEDAGYKVEYLGIMNKKYDFGRDLICRNKKDTLIIQCKNWSKSKIIKSHWIYQLYGTKTQYAIENPNEKVSALFYTTTRFSPNAIRAANILGVKLYEKYKMHKPFPVIKCIFESKKFFLPSDKNYSQIFLDIDKGDRYFTTVKEAVDAGFHR